MKQTFQSQTFFLEYESSSSLDRDNKDNKGEYGTSRSILLEINGFTRMLALKEISSEYKSLIDNTTCTRMNNLEGRTSDDNQIEPFFDKDQDKKLS